MNGLPRWLSGKESACNLGNARDAGSIPGSGRAPGGGHGNPLQYSSLGNPMDREAWQATVHGATKSWTHLSNVSTAVKRWPCPLLSCSCSLPPTHPSPSLFFFFLAAFMDSDGFPLTFFGVPPFSSIYFYIIVVTLHVQFYMLLSAT